jgi:hypothetical protein
MDYIYFSIICPALIYTFISYSNVGPTLFRIGDIVEAQVSFVVFPGKNEQRNMRVLLRSIALLDGRFTQVII